ncbi:hypothetical protein [Mesorhizobium sp. KR9-304]|uniref:hypothetical protein n=1 Tax=Mesorhizobium sp. KR9-304 TaxID=3156614 RepID=UPI0032B324D4
MSVLRRTGAPDLPTVEALVCAFANGSCLCAETGKEPCITVKIAADRIRNRVEHDLAVARRGKAVPA